MGEEQAIGGAGEAILGGGTEFSPLQNVGETFDEFEKGQN